MLHRGRAFLLSSSPQPHCLARRVINTVWSRKLINCFNILCLLNVSVENYNIMALYNFKYKSFCGNFNICAVWWFLKRWISNFILRLSLILRKGNPWENLNLPLLLNIDICHSLHLLIYLPCSTLHYFIIVLLKSL